MKNKLEIMLMNKYKISRSRALLLIKNNVVFVNDMCINDRCFMTNENIIIKIPTFNWKILWSDKNLVIVYKPHGMIVEECNTTSIIHQVLTKELRNSLQLESVFPLHRLDKETCGIMLFALNLPAAEYYGNLIRERKFFKVYKAFYENMSFNMENFHYFTCKHENLVFSYENKCLCEEQYEPCIITINEDVNGPRLVKNGNKRCETLMKPIIGGYECALITGRTHQIRLTMKSLNKVIAGDKFYGSRDSCEMQLFSYYIHINKDLML